MRAATVVQQLCKSCRTCLTFYCMFYFTCDRSLSECVNESCWRVIGYGRSLSCAFHSHTSARQATHWTQCARSLRPIIPFRSSERRPASSREPAYIAPSSSRYRYDVMIAVRRLPVTWCWPALLAVVAVASRHAAAAENTGGEMGFPGRGVTSTERGKTVNLYTTC